MGNVNTRAFASNTSSTSTAGTHAFWRQPARDDALVDARTSGALDGAGQLAPRTERLVVPGPGHAREVGDEPGRGASVALAERVCDVGPAAADAEVVEQLVVDLRGHAREVAGLLTLAHARRRPFAAELVEYERVVRRRAVERNLHPRHLAPLLHLVARRARRGERRDD